MNKNLQMKNKIDLLFVIILKYTLTLLCSVGVLKSYCVRVSVTHCPTYPFATNHKNKFLVFPYSMLPDKKRTRKAKFK